MWLCIFHGSVVEMTSATRGAKGWRVNLLVCCRGTLDVPLDLGLGTGSVVVAWWELAIPWASAFAGMGIIEDSSMAVTVIVVSSSSSSHDNQPKMGIRPPARISVVNPHLVERMGDPG